MSSNLLRFKSNVYSQNGEDGIIEHLFATIGDGSRACCEFGAWDGIHLSNCRRLVEQGWTAVFIEGDPVRYRDLERNYASTPGVITVNRFVDAGENSLDHILTESGSDQLDFLSIDIDGLDYEIFASLKIRPRVICVEVNAGHDPASDLPIAVEIARNNVGQPLARFVSTAAEMGYGLLCYTGNAFFLRRDVGDEFGIQPVDPTVAYRGFISELASHEREWLYLVNLGLVAPNYAYANPHLTRDGLGIGRLRAFRRIVAAALRGGLLSRRLTRSAQTTR